MQDIILDGRKCHIHQEGEGGPLLLWGMFPFREDDVEHTLDEIRKAVPERSWILAAYEAKSWNADFSPWPAVLPGDDSDGSARGMSREDREFCGEGAATLKFLEDAYLPYLKENFPESKGAPVYVLGYSLAGLFSLWALYESEAFDGGASCSGSLWYPDWMEFSRNHPCHGKRVYLSLGGKEAETKNARMATIADKTREEERILRRDESVKNVKLEWNGGGHFADSGKRLAKAVKWLLGE